MDSADSHFGGNLHNAVKHRVIVIVHRRIIILIQHMIVNQLPDALLSQIGIDGAGAVAQQCGKMMYFSGFPGFQNQGHPCSLFRAYQILVQGGHCQQGGDGHMVLVHSSVGKNQNIDAVPICPVHFHKEPVNGPLQTGIFIIGNRNHLYPKALRLHIFNLQQIRICQYGVVDPQHIAVLGSFF